MRFVIYTAIFGRFPDRLYPPQNVPDDVTLHCYTDVPTARPGPGGWVLMPPVWDHSTNPRLRARRHKLLSHKLYPQAEVTLWVDGCLTPKIGPEQLAATYLTAGRDLCVFRHMQRSCVYDEMAACKALRKDLPAVIDRVKQRYEYEEYPAGRGLGETTAVLRRHTSDMSRFNESWWQELRNNSIRDQLSFDYVSWRLGLSYSHFAGTRCQSPHFEWRSHR